MDSLAELPKIYEKRNSDIIEFFSNTQNLLIMDLEKGDSWEKLCTFLNHDIPNEPFPHLNKTK